jgi:hypothetical protein
MHTNWLPYASLSTLSHIKYQFLPSQHTQMKCVYSLYAIRHKDSYVSIICMKCMKSGSIYLLFHLLECPFCSTQILRRFGAESLY